MRLAALTILPMLLAAGLVLFGGERLARETSETRIPHDRERFLDFADQFRAEVVRLDSLYVGHLERLATAMLEEEEAFVKNAAADITAVQTVTSFRKIGPDLEVAVQPQNSSAPSLLAKGTRTPLLGQRYLEVDVDELSESLDSEGAWLPTDNSRFRLYCTQPKPKKIVAILIDQSLLQQRVEEHFTKWIAETAGPLSEAEELVAVLSPSEKALASFGGGKAGPAAAVIPERTLFGTFELRAWDRLQTTSRYNLPVLISAILLAAFFLAAGILLYLQQRRALRLAQQRVSFVNRVSHELGSPLTNLMLNLDLANEALPHQPESAKARLDVVAEESARLSRLVKNVLTFSRRERNSLTCEPELGSPQEDIISAVDAFRPAFQRRSIEVELQLNDAPPLLFDRDAFRQIISNLLSNVEKYAADGQWVGIGMNADENFLTVEISDDGTGIPARDRDRVFAPFERVHSQTCEGVSGTGLGLTIARELAEKMGGTLRLVESSRGATFRLALPANSTAKVIPIRTEAA